MAGQRKQQGQGSVEFLVIFVLFLALLGGVFEMTRVFRTKNTLNTATFAAARVGALNNARLAPMNAELANDMASLFAADANSAGETETALERARAFATALRAAGGGVQIVSPTRAVFAQLHKTQFVPNANDTALRKIEVIPNDNLRARAGTAASFKVDGDVHKINLQDANLLKIRTLWCKRLVVPALDAVIFAIVNAVPYLNARQQVCSDISGGENGGEGGAGVVDGYYIAITSQATIRMQTPVVENDLP
ncbi:TadE/TadG family type IV pilus assembly protein [Salinisphaera sp.]|uniref:TadE/TadG family type IV pilus assembly protein n=1 Tax=Salinisphaera sp. TaxID=1914330 RepID=UPI002D76BC7D|nr:TadE/TadG family type IV pilus assembly protein [Salinisphaera sp.]HET7314085.1 TadE/TadG family type IV pilus assembly protein [Salinisphaera sp.]